MKEKRISLVTYIVSLIIMVLAVGLIVVCIIKNQNNKNMSSGISNNGTELQETTNEVEVNNVTNENNSSTISQSITNNNNESSTGIKLLQFDTEFYNLKDIALEYREIGNIKNYKDFEYDLDEDGVKDKVTIKHRTEKVDYGNGSENKYSIQLNGKSFLDSDTDDIATIDKLYIADLNKNDNKIEVVFEGNGPSDDPHYLIYSKEKSKMNRILAVGGYYLKGDKAGNIVISDYLINGITPEIYNEYYNINNGKVVEKTAKLDAIKDMTLKSEGWLCFTQDKNNLKKYRERDYSSEENIENYETWEKQNLEKYGIYHYKEEIKFKLIKFEKDDNFDWRSYES